MSLDLLNTKGHPLDKQIFNWKELAQKPFSKLDDDAFSRVRVILMSAIESEAQRFQHSCARMNRELQLPLAKIRRVEQHQATLINWLNPPDQSPLETTIAYEQAVIEVTASVAQNESDSYLSQVYRFGMLENFDHLYRFSALLDRMEGKDANNILQSYTDIRAGRPTSDQHRDPEDDLRDSYDRAKAKPISKFNAITVLGIEQQTRDYYMNIGPLFSDPVARQLYAEVASIEEQHVTQYESIIDPKETWLEKWLLHEATEVYNYYSCVQQESNPRIKAIWERFLNYEFGHLNAVVELFKNIERRDPAEILPSTLPDPISFKSQREVIRKTLTQEINLRAKGPRFVEKDQENQKSIFYRTQLNSEGSPSETIATGYQWMPGTELVERPKVA